MAVLSPREPANTIAHVLRKIPSLADSATMTLHNTRRISRDIVTTGKELAHHLGTGISGSPAHKMRQTSMKRPRRCTDKSW